jgi:hypothetical protein
MRLVVTYSLLVLAALVESALAWGAAGTYDVVRPAAKGGSVDQWPATHKPGHEIVATIAEIHLHPDAKSQLCSILPAEAKCHLAPIAAWADTIRGRMRETAPMHYINREFRALGWSDRKHADEPASTTDCQPSKIILQSIALMERLDGPTTM